MKKAKMVKISDVRERLRSNVLKELARERASKRPRLGEKEDSDTEDTKNEELERPTTQTKVKSDNLLSILPKPKNSNAFGPSVRLDRLLKMPKRADESSSSIQEKESVVDRLNDDGMVEVDVGKVIGEDANQTRIRELTIEKVKSSVIVPKGKEKQKNQITYLAQLGKANELERKEQAAQSRLNKAAARSKYGW